MSIELRQAAQQALNALDEATTYTGSPSWSPSMTDECIAAASALRAALAQQPVTRLPKDVVIGHVTLCKGSNISLLVEYAKRLNADVERLEAKQPATGEPVGFTYQAEIEYANSTGGNGSFWRVPPDLDDEAVPLYTHPAPSVRAGVVRDAERYRWLRNLDHWPAPFSSSQEPEPIRGSDLDAAIDAAMLAAKDSK